MRLVLPGILLLAACAMREPLLSPGPPPLTSPPRALTLDEPEVDLLFVIDNSNSSVNQQTIAVGFRALLESVSGPRFGASGLPDLHLGVVSSDLGAGNYSLPSCEVAGGDGGKLMHTPRIAGCSLPRDPWIGHRRGETNLPAASADLVQTLFDAFRCIAELGTGGCGFEHPLEAARRALAPSTNPGFLRDGSLLVIALLTDEDDCSAARPGLFDPADQTLDGPLGPLTSFRCTEHSLVCDEPLREPGIKHGCRPGKDWLVPVEEYARFLKETRPPGRAIPFFVTGPSEAIEVVLEGQNPSLKMSCQGAMGNALPAPRLAALARALAPGALHNPEGAVCQSDLKPSFRRLGERMLRAERLRCLGAPPLLAGGERLACAEGDEPGPGARCDRGCLEEADCTVGSIEARGTPAEQLRPIPRCPPAAFDPAVTGCQAPACPCWRILRAADFCAAPPYALEILRAAGDEAPSTVSRAVCTTTSLAWGSAELAAVPRCR